MLTTEARAGEEPALQSYPLDMDGRVMRSDGAIGYPCPHSAGYRGPRIVSYTGLGQATAEGDRASPALKQNAPQIVYINTEGASLSSGWDDATQNSTTFSEYAGYYPAWGGSQADLDAIIALIQDDFSAYNVRIVGERPTSGEYTMIMVGPGPLSGGYAPLDCSNDNESNIAFVNNNGWVDDGAAALIAHEAGHTFGLEHISDYDAIMNPTIYGGSSFKNACYYSVGCGSNAQGCGQGGQNSHATLLSIFGPSSPDTQAPSVSLSSPSDGAVFATGSAIDVVALADDDVAVVGVTLFVDNDEIRTEERAPYEWTLNNLAVGQHRLTAVASDSAGNETTSLDIRITIEDDQDPTTGNNDDEGTSDDGGDPEESTGDEDEGSETGDDGGLDDDGGSTGTGSGTGTGGDSGTEGDTGHDSGLGTDTSNPDFTTGPGPDLGGSDFDSNTGCRMNQAPPSLPLAFVLVLVSTLPLGRRGSL